MSKLLVYFFVKQYCLILSSTYIINASNFFVQSALLSSKQHIFLICLYFSLLSALVKSSSILTLMCLSTSSLDKSATVSTWHEWSVWINFDILGKPRLREHVDYINSKSFYIVRLSNIGFIIIKLTKFLINSQQTVCFYYFKHFLTYFFD